MQVLERCMEIRKMLESIVRWNATRMKMVKPVMEIYAAVQKVTMDPKVPERYRILARARAWSWFEPIKKALRVSREMNSTESAKEVPDIAMISMNLNASLSPIMKEGESTGSDLGRMSKIFRNRIEEHREELLSPVMLDGRIINVKRHNGHRGDRSQVERDAYPKTHGKITDCKGYGNVWCPNSDTIQR